MQVAVNYSKEVENLVKNNLVKIDLFKAPDFSKDLVEHAKQLVPSYVHFGLNAGSGKMEQVNWELVKELRELTQTPYINVHAVAFSKDYPEIDIMTKDSTIVKRIVDAAIRDIEYAANLFGAENIILENVICRGRGENMMSPIVEPAVLKKIVERTGCGFLLDTAHAQMTSMCLGLNVRDYISELPLDHLKELHITGIQPDESGRLRDSMPMTKVDWNIATWVINQIKEGKWPEPWVVSFEYGGVGPAFEWRSDEKVLAEQLPKLYTLVK